MRTLVVPDVHEQVRVVRRILDEYGPPHVDRVVFLGDIFDSFTPGGAEETIDWFADAVQRDDYEWCLGNHDLPYIAPEGLYACPGFRQAKWIMIHNRVNIDRWRRRAHLSIDVGRYLCSHAGYAPALLPARVQERGALRYIYTAPSRLTHALLSIGAERGGFAGDVGGPLWMDWDVLVDIEGCPQIVGHTPSKTVRQKGASYCLDTFLHHVGIVEDDGELQIVEVARARILTPYSGPRP